MITGINHINLSVSHLESSIHFYRNILGFKLLAKWDNGAYFLAGNLWFCLNLDKHARTEPLAEYTHIAFNIKQEDFAKAEEIINKAGIKLWKQNTSEGDSLYILDPNGHKLELHCTDVTSRLAAVKKAPYKGMVFFD